MKLASHNSAEGEVIIPDSQLGSQIPDDIPVPNLGPTEAFKSPEQPSIRPTQAAGGKADRQVTRSVATVTQQALYAETTPSTGDAGTTVKPAHESSEATSSSGATNSKAQVATAWDSVVMPTSVRVVAPEDEPVFLQEVSPTTNPAARSSISALAEMPPVLDYIQKNPKLDAFGRLEEQRNRKASQNSAKGRSPLTPQNKEQPDSQPGRPSKGILKNSSVVTEKPPPDFPWHSGAIQRGNDTQAPQKELSSSNRHSLSGLNRQASLSRDMVAQKHAQPSTARDSQAKKASKRDSTVTFNSRTHPLPQMNGKRKFTALDSSNAESTEPAPKRISLPVSGSQDRGSRYNSKPAQAKVVEPKSLTRICTDIYQILGPDGQPSLEIFPV
jgi:hypothetical protein